MEFSLGRAIRDRRAELGLTQEALADRMAELGDDAMRQSDVSRLEIGQIQMPRLPRLEILARALELDIGMLLVSAGWLDEDNMPAGDDRDDAVPKDATAGRSAATPAESDNVLEAEIESPGQVYGVRERTIQHAYGHLADALGNSEMRATDFNQLRIEFQRLVEEFERAKEEFEQEHDSGGSSSFA
ncbi:MAG: helix-turn-helix domain-containing protein [Thermomicrobiales bacterium]